MNDQSTQVAGATVECDCGGDGAPKGFIVHPDRTQPFLYQEHERCKGRVFALSDATGVREKCPECSGDGILYDVTIGDFTTCRDCQGRGWDASTDLVVVIDCLIELGFQPLFERDHVGRCITVLYQDTVHPWGDGGDADTWLESGYIALARALVAQGAKLMEVLG